MSTAITLERDIRSGGAMNLRSTRPAPSQIGHPNEIRFRSVLIKPGTALPEPLFPSLRRIGDWNLIADFDSFAFSQALIKENWHFSFVVPAIQKSAWRRTQEKALRAALRKLVEELTINKFNAFEVTSVTTRCLFGFYRVQIAGHASHVAASPFINERHGPSQRETRSFDPHFEILEIANTARRLRSSRNGGQRDAGGAR